jgi:hypothetical protein
VVVCAAVALPAIAPVSAAAADWRWPVRGRVLAPYENDNSRPYAAGMHRGIDVAAGVGTPVVAARSGSVTFAGPLGSAGLTVAIRASGGRYATSYLHLSRVDVKRGASVAGGQRIGAVGATGSRSTQEPHLHFGVRLAGAEHSYVDPLSLLPPLPGAQPSVPVAPIAARAPVRPQPHAVRVRVNAVPASGPRVARPRWAPLPSRPIPRVVPGVSASPFDWAPWLALAGLALVAAAAVGRLRLTSLTTSKRSGLSASGETGGRAARRRAWRRADAARADGAAPRVVRWGGTGP